MGNRAAAVILAAYLFGTAALNRRFVHVHFSVSGIPIYVSELFLGLAGIFALFHLKVFLSSTRGNRAVKIFMGAAAALVLISLVPIALDLDAFSVDAIRNAALGYYAVAGVIAAVLLAPYGAPRLLSFWIVAGGVVAVILLWTGNALGSSALPPWVGGFHGLPALAASTACAVLLLSVDWPKKASIPLAALLCLFVTTPLVTGGKSVVLATVLTFGIFLPLVFKRLSSVKKRAFCAALIVAAASLGLRMAGIVRLPSQDVWKGAWLSWSKLAPTIRTVSEERAERNLDPGAKVPSAALPSALRAGDSFAVEGGSVSFNRVLAVHNEVRVPADFAPDLTKEIGLYPEHRILLLISPILTESFLKKRLPGNLNNVAWRLELWRLAAMATLRHGPVFGLPPAVQIHYAAFGFYNYSARTDLHNSHLAFFVRFGGVGAAMYLLAVAVAISRPLGRWKERGDLADAAMASVLAMYVSLSCSNVVLESPHFAVPFWLLAGAAVVGIRRPPARANPA